MPYPHQEQYWPVTVLPHTQYHSPDSGSGLDTELDCEGGGVSAVSWH